MMRREEDMLHFHVFTDAQALWCALSLVAPAFLAMSWAVARGYLFTVATSSYFKPFINVLSHSAPEK